VVGAMDDSESPRMAARLVKFSISLAFYTVSESWRMLRRLGGGTATPNAVVIYYHHVLADQRARFSRQLDHLQRYSQPLSTAQKEPLGPAARYSMVTADDGWKSFADHALPEIARRNIPVTIFAISRRLGQSVDGITFDRLLSADELRALDMKIVTVGSHTASHAKMSALNERDALRELRESRDQLSAVLGRDVTMFCFPYGAYRDDLIPLCRQAGYDRVFTCMPELADPSRFVLGRVRVDPTDWPLEFHLKLMGAYRWLPMAIALKRRLRAALGAGSEMVDQSPEIPAS
jgi:peptidoglycan/xylan/chitin deacetylase (PgdA/CDA1 family)